MSKELRCIMLIDDNPADNFYHEREIKKINPDYIVIAKNTGWEALEYLKSLKDSKNVGPDPIFLDINMPGMNGWEFLEEYTKLDKEIRSRAIIINKRIAVIHKRYIHSIQKNAKQIRNEKFVN